MTNKRDLLEELAELGLSGNKQGILHFLERLAVEEIKNNKHTSYNRLLDLIEKYSNSFKNISTSSVGLSSFSAYKDIWISPSIDLKIHRFIKIHEGSPASFIGHQFNKLLLYGPPGSGKTTLGFYIGEKLKKSVNYVKITDVISSKLGETMHNIATVFNSDKDEVIFIDEFDAFAKDRNDRNDVGELKRIVNSIIQTLDFYSNNKIVIVATNLLDSIDPAILRRFKFKILVDELFDGEKGLFIKYLIKKNNKINIQLDAEQQTFLVDILDRLKINTVDEITDYFDKAIISTIVEDRSQLKFDDFVKVLFTEDYLKNPKIINKKDREIVSKLCKIMEQMGCSKIKIAWYMGIHRNSYKNYVQ